MSEPQRIDTRRPHETGKRDEGRDEKENDTTSRQRMTQENELTKTAHASCPQADTRKSNEPQSETIGRDEKREAKSRHRPAEAYRPTPRTDYTTLPRDGDDTIRPDDTGTRKRARGKTWRKKKKEAECPSPADMDELLKTARRTGTAVLPHIASFHLLVSRIAATASLCRSPQRNHRGVRAFANRFAYAIIRHAVIIIAS